MVASDKIRVPLLAYAPRRVGANLDKQKKWLLTVASDKICTPLLAYEDSNLDKQNQNLSYYHYTIGQCPSLIFKGVQK